MDLGLKDKRVLVTGATRGIGRATARVFAEEGARVAITYHSAVDAANDVVEELGGQDRACAVRYDLNDPQLIEQAVRTVEERWGGIDVLVANAQSFVWSDPDKLPYFENLDVDEGFTLFRGNSEGHMLAIRAALGGMRRQGWGRIVLLSSVTAKHGRFGAEIYSAAKASLHGFVRGLMWTGDGVLANVVAPGGTLTESLQAVDPELLKQGIAETPSGRLSTPEEVARVIVFLCSEANGNVNGEVIHTAGGR
ncbi:3-oxoacyl-[acyl-carrier protein] reductase [Kibdelosporangium banguiense]|uniref:3-oxoacyl-[acyl-carrier protein] reductase n=1 Tax=Kibdelosporangium banguiense TaxID=1365924 RepID=A0ABS4TS63_9PSEU|nr:SDR family oxidoreductase [Kibdelosporangium banguiense]MBP2327250.1 3-oxoacyl-[acyl-carrier protein] reductase [Kibdelosporangium banguiense]